MSHLEIARRSTRGSFALFFGNLVTTVISFVAITAIARLLGPSDYGVYALCVLLPNLLLNLLGFGVTSGITRFAAYHLARGSPTVAKRMTLNGVSFILIFGVVLTAFSYLAAGFLSTYLLKRPEIGSVERFACLLVLGQSVFQSGIAALLGWSRMGGISVTNVTQAILRLAVAVPLVVLGFAVYGALTGYIVSLLVSGGAALILLTPRMGPSGFKPLEFFASDVRTMLGYSWSIFIGLFANNIMPQYALVVLASFAANSYVGLYDSANNFVSAITIASGAITQALFPAFAHLEGTSGDLKLAFSHATKYMSFALTPLIFLLMGASVQVIGVALGASYAQASGYLTLLAFTNISVIFGSGVLPSFFNGVGSPKHYMTFSLVAAGVLLALAPFLSLVLGLGVPGLILAILTANLIAAGVGLFLAHRHFGAGIDVRAALSILASSILAFLCILPFETSHLDGLIALTAEIAVFVLVYSTVAPLLGAIKMQDIQTLSSALEGLGSYKGAMLKFLAYERFVLQHSRRWERTPS